MKESERRLIFHRTVEPRDPSLGEPEEVKIEAIEIFGIPDVMVSGLYEGQWIANRGERSVVQMLLADLEAAKAEVERLRKKEAALESVVVERKRLHDAIRKSRDAAQALAAGLRDALAMMMAAPAYCSCSPESGCKAAVAREAARQVLAASESLAPAPETCRCCNGTGRMVTSNLLASDPPQPTLEQRCAMCLGTGKYPASGSDKSEVGE